MILGGEELKKIAIVGMSLLLVLGLAWGISTGDNQYNQNQTTDYKPPYPMPPAT